MSQLSDDIINYLTGTGLFTGYVDQWGRWTENKDKPQEKYLVIIPQSGSSAKPWFREPRYSIYIIGGRGDGWMGLPESVGEVANSLVEYIRANISSDCHAFLEAIGEPVGPSFSEEDRPIYQINVRTFTKR